jgi:hypothetical protein
MFSALALSTTLSVMLIACWRAWITASSVCRSCPA